MVNNGSCFSERVSLQKGNYMRKVIGNNIKKFLEF